MKEHINPIVDAKLLIKKIFEVIKLINSFKID